MKWGFGWVFEGVAYRVAEGTYIVSGPGFFNQGGETRFQIFRQKRTAIMSLKLAVTSGKHLSLN